MSIQQRNDKQNVHGLVDTTGAESLYHAETARSCDEPSVKGSTQLSDVQKLYK